MIVFEESLGDVVFPYGMFCTNQELGRDVTESVGVFAAKVGAESALRRSKKLGLYSIGNLFHGDAAYTVPIEICVDGDVG